MKKILFSLAVVSAFISCKKNNDELRAVSSYTVVNATTDVTNARIIVADHDISWKALPATDAAGQYKQVNLSTYEGSNTIKVVSGADTTVSLYSSQKAEEFTEGVTTNLFLAGKAGAYEGLLLLNESLPQYTDSVTGIRFINLVANSTPLTITLATSATLTEAAGLSYKQITGFKTYPALQSSAAMVFQVRDAAGTLLASYTLPFSGSGTYNTAGIANGRFKNITLVIKGQQGTTTGTNALGIFPVSHY